MTSPLDTFLVEEPGVDPVAEIAALWERQVLVDAIAHGEVPLEHLLDCLSDQGQDPEEYLECVDENLNAFFEATPEALLYLPY